jgi:hypothetical protein
MDKLELLRDRKVFEAVFRNGGSIEADVTKGEGEDTRSYTERFDYSVHEVLSTADATYFFPRVVSNQMLEAAEPILTIVPLLNKVQITTTANTIDYYAMGALQAHEVPEGMEFPEEKAVWAKAARTAKVTKKGLKVPITQELLDDNLFDVVGMYIRAAGRAMARYKEKLAVKRFLEAAALSSSILYDNDDGGKPDTTGKGSDFLANKSLDGRDLLKMFAQMLASGRTPTDVIMHPLAWTMFAEDPIIKSLQWYNRVPSPAPSMQYVDGNRTPADGFYGAFLQNTMPFGINVITSPHVPFTADIGGGEPGVSKTDIFIVDRNDLGVLTVRDELSTDQWNDPTRDIVAMKVKERYDVTILDTEGLNVVAAKGIRLNRNYGNDVEFVKNV